MSDGVLAAIIAASATVFAAFLQIKSRVRQGSGGAGVSLRPRDARAGCLMLMMVIMLGGAAVGGFALSQWLTEHERAIQNAQLESLQASVATLSRSESQLAQVRADARAEIESALLRKQGMDGVVVMATVAPCKPPLLINTPALAAGAGTSQPNPMPAQSNSTSSASACTEGEASPVTLCATVPVNAKVTEVELYARAAEGDVPWANSRFTAGSEFEQARFADKAVEVMDGACHEAGVPDLLAMVHGACAHGAHAGALRAVAAARGTAEKRTCGLEEAAGQFRRRPYISSPRRASHAAAAPRKSDNRPQLQHERLSRLPLDGRDRDFRHPWPELGMSRRSWPMRRTHKRITAPPLAHRLVAC